MVGLGGGASGDCGLTLANTGVQLFRKYTGGTS